MLIFAIEMIWQGIINLCLHGFIKLIFFDPYFGEGNAGLVLKNMNMFGVISIF